MSTSRKAGETPERWIALCGGIGGAKLALGLAHAAHLAERRSEPDEVEAARLRAIPEFAGLLAHSRP